MRACEEVLKTGVGLAARSSTSGTSRWGRNHFLPLEPSLAYSANPGRGQSRPEASGLAGWAEGRPGCGRRRPLLRGLPAVVPVAKLSARARIAGRARPLTGKTAAPIPSRPRAPSVPQARRSPGTPAECPPRAPGDG